MCHGDFRGRSSRAVGIAGGRSPSRTIFRQVMYHRITKLPIDVAPLRSRVKQFVATTAWQFDNIPLGGDTRAVKRHATPNWKLKSHKNSAVGGPRTTPVATAPPCAGTVPSCRGIRLIQDSHFRRYPLRLLVPWCIWRLAFQGALSMVTTDDGFEMRSNKGNLVDRFWEYRRTDFAVGDDYFDQPLVPTGRPPVFRKDHASRNVLLKGAISEPVNIKVLDTIPEGKRHKWFGSMASSQALTHSVFGNLIAHGKLDCLQGLVGDDGKPLFIRDSGHGSKCQLEFEVDYLGEKNRGRTSIDVLFDGDYRIAVECKLSEEEVGSCSRPRLVAGDPSFEAQHCDGSYMVQSPRKSRCSLT